MSRLSQQQHQMLPPAHSPEMNDSGLVIKLLMVNGDSRSLRIYKWYTVNDVLKDILPRLRVNMDTALDWFGIQFRNAVTKECYWLQPGYPILQLVHEYSSASSVAEWQFLLLIRILPKTPQHISDVDPISFQYFFDQILHQYLSNDSIVVENEVAVKLGCLELRRFFKDMPHAALKKKENFTMLEKEIGLEKFFKRSLLQTTRKKPLRNLVLTEFKDYEHMSTESCMFQFFNVLSKFHHIDEDFFVNCAVGLNPSLPFNSVIYVGPNCNIEYQDHSKDRRFLAAFVDIQGISYESEMMERGKIILELRNNPAVVIHTVHLVAAIDMASLIDSYCIVYTENHHSRLTGLKRFSSSNMSEGLYNTIDELRSQQPHSVPPLRGTRPLSYSAFRSSSATGEYSSIPGSEYSDTDMYEVLPMKGYRTIAPQDLSLREKIGEGQFGDVHNGFLYPGTQDEREVAIKTCKQDASQEDRAKFLEEAMVMCKFKHPNIIKLFGVVSHMNLAYIVMELAPHGQLRRYLLVEGMSISRIMLLSYIVQLSSAMVHLEEMNFVHRDIAARNILVCNPQTVKLADFGLSRGLEDGDYYVASRGKLPIKWMAPESINFRRFTGLSDVWMFGVCCWEVLMRGVKPFVGIKNDEVISKIETGERLHLPAECPSHLFVLMNSCWNYDPLDRPRFVEIEARIQEILLEEAQLEQQSGRRFNHAELVQKSISPIQRDPDAPSKPLRQYGGWEPASTGFSLGRVSSDSNSSRLSHSNDLQRDDVPPLPPRAMERFRDLSDSPTPPIGEGGLSQYAMGMPSSRSHRGGGVTDSPRSNHAPSHAISSSSSLVPPYSVTTIGPSQQQQQQHYHHQSQQHYLDQRRQATSPQLYHHTPSSSQESSGGPMGSQLPPNAHIPPPAILGQYQQQQQQQQQHAPHSPHSPHAPHPPHSQTSLSVNQQRILPDPDITGGLYYSSSSSQELLPAASGGDRVLLGPLGQEKKQQRMLTKDGVFVSRDILGSNSLGDMSPGEGVRPRLEGRPASHGSTEGSSGRSSPAVSVDDRRQQQPTPPMFIAPPPPPADEARGQEEDGFKPPEEDDVLKYATGVVKSVKELSDKVHKCKPSDYVDLVKNVGFALRELLGKVDAALGDLPAETHPEVVMAQKVLTSDMNQLVAAMKDAQSHYDRFLEQEYQKKMLKAAHVVAVNSKLLLDAVNSARRKAHLMR